MNPISSSRMRALDAYTISEHGTPGAVLMERAGRAVADAVAEVARLSGRSGPVLCVAGKGNNGGDAFVTARALASAGVPSAVILATAPDALSGDAKLHFERLDAEGIRWIALEAFGADDTRLPGTPAGRLFVDGILGTGVSGAPRGGAADGIALLQHLGAQSPVIAIDIPSGLDADTGRAAGACVRADLTVTLGFPKRGLLTPDSRAYVGSLMVADIGIVEDGHEEPDPGIDLIAAPDFVASFGRRPRAAHKGTCGHVLLIGGSPGYAGAVAMAAAAALRSGVGLVSVLTPAPVAAVVAGLVPGAMVHAGPTESGRLGKGSLAVLPAGLSAFDAVLIGPGLGRDDVTRGLVQHLLATVEQPLVLDADALPGAHDAAALKGARGPLILTPHPGELARLLGIDAARVQADRPAALAAAVDRTLQTVVLKGDGTLVGAPETTPAINLTGNPGMAVGGMGDVLAGLVTGLLAQGISPQTAARAAVFLHGLAGDRAAWRHTQRALTPLDVIAALPDAFRALCAL